MSSTEGAAPESDGSDVCYDVVSDRDFAIADGWMISDLRDGSIG